MSIVFDVVGGTEPYIFTLESGSIPAGLELNPQGNMFGTPTGTGLSTFDLRVTDAVGSFQIKQFTIRVIEITSPVSLPAGTTGTPYSYTLTQSGAGTPLWALADGTLPDGLTLNSLTGEISGTPTTAGTSIFTLTLLDAGNEICSKAFDLEIVAAVGLLAYWTFDDYDIDNLILDSTTNDFDITYATVDGV
ncbi:MAG TPA: Ig domain-containing protein, partial [Anaerolineales bacterium]|nr:Ig domain-containing protein [Anaerolineales bacterium]